MEDTALDKETLITLTADIVSAHVSNNSVGVDDVSGLISNVHPRFPVLAEACRLKLARSLRYRCGLR